MNFLNSRVYFVIQSGSDVEPADFRAAPAPALTSAPAPAPVIKKINLKFYRFL